MKNYLLLLFLSTTAIWAQSASVNGLIRDPADAAVASASVRVIQTQTNMVRTTQSDETGGYHVSNLPPGEYKVVVEKAGFEKLEREGVVLLVDTATRVDLKLRTGSIQQTLTVSEDAFGLQPNNAEMATDITSKQYTDLPLVQAGRIRSPTSFVYLAPGVQGNIRLDGAEYTGATNVIAVNGSNIWNTELLIEGMPGGQTRITGNYTESAPAVDAITEFRITTTLLPADYGHTGSAVGSFAVKSGTNQFHGSFYEYLRNNVLDANNWLANSSGAVHPPTRQNEFGTTVGGPLNIPRLYRGTDRTFFFFAYGASRKTGADAFVTAQIPTPKELTGDFSGLAAIYDPHSNAPNPAGTGYIRTVFAGNIVPLSVQDPVARKIAALYPAPNLAGANNYGSFDGEEILSPDTYTGKLDRTFSEKNHLSATYIRTYIPRLRLDNALPEPLTAGIHQFVGSHTGRIADIWSPSATVVNEARAGFNRFTNPQDATSTPENYPATLGLTGLSGTVFPSIGFTNGFTTIGNTTASRASENDFYYRDTLHWTIRQHSLRMGAEFRRTQYNDQSPCQQTSSIAFNSLETANPQSNSNTGNGFASFLLGAAHSGTVTNPFALYTRKSYAGWFVQDDWRVTSKLTLNLGLHGERSGAPTEARGHSSIVSLSTANPAAGNLPGALIFGGNLFPQGPAAWGPRAGFAWQTVPRIVIRGGYGLYYVDILPNTGLTSSGYQVAGSFASPDNGVTPAFYLASGVPQNYAQTSSLVPGVLNGQNANYYDPNAGRMPRIQDWSFNIQGQIARTLTLEVAYVGNHGSGLVAPQLQNINQLDPKYLALGTLLTQPATSAAAVAAGVSLPYPGFSGTVAQALRPYPQYLTLTSVAAKDGASKYNALELVLTKRSSSGFTFDGNYTFSKAMGYNNTSLAGNTGVDNTLQNAFNARPEWSLLPQDVTHAFTTHYSYELPLGGGKRWMNAGRLENAVFGGWTISAVQRYQSGFPFSLLTKNTLPIFNRVLRPNLIPGVDPSSGISNADFNPAVNSVFNKAAFSAPVNSFGNAAPAYSNLRNFPVLSEDVSVVKRLSLTERVQLQFYAQGFNLLNRHRFTGIDTNFSDAGFGVPTATNQARQVQFGARINY
jgi:hypothetical protein